MAYFINIKDTKTVNLTSITFQNIVIRTGSLIQASNIDTLTLQNIYISSNTITEGNSIVIS
jgi:hypothetical protein